MKYFGRKKSTVEQSISEMVNSLSRAELLSLIEILDRRILLKAVKKALEQMLLDEAK